MVNLQLETAYDWEHHESWGFGEAVRSLTSQDILYENRGKSWCLLEQNL